MEIEKDLDAKDRQIESLMLEMRSLGQEIESREDLYKM